jgi:hypothetical protein
MKPESTAGTKSFAATTNTPATAMSASKDLEKAPWKNCGSRRHEIQTDRTAPIVKQMIVRIAQRQQVTGVTEAQASGARLQETDLRCLRDTSRADCDLQRLGRLQSLAKNAVFGRNFSDGIGMNNVASIRHAQPKGNFEVVRSGL